MSTENQELTEKSAIVKVPEVVVTKEDNWETVGMIIVLVLSIYIGIKSINYYFDRKKNSLW